MGDPTSSSHPAPRSWLERAGDWLSEESLTWLLVLLVVDLFALPSFGTRIGGTVVNVVFTILLFTGLATVANRRVAFVAVGILVLATAGLRWAATVPHLAGASLMAAGAAVAVFAVLTLLVLLRTLSPGPITRQRIEGAVATYLLIATTFALTFELLETLQPGSLHLGETALEDLSQSVGYFSLVTLTTVGYGDVTPVSPLARRLAGLEGLIGQLYPAIIIGWMIGSMRRRRD